MASIRNAAFAMSLVIGAGFVQQAHATACPMGVLCDAISLNLTTLELDDGRWRYDYTVEDLYFAYDPGVPVTPVSVSYTFAELRLPYFDDAAITAIQVGSQYSGQLTAQVIDAPLGKADRTIVVSAGDHPIVTKSPATVLRGVNNLLSFISDYAPAFNVPASVTLVNDAGWNEELAVFRSSALDPLHRGPWLAQEVGAPASPMAIPEADTLVMGLAGLGTLLASLRARRHPL
jgi:hypothetical protein